MPDPTYQETVTSNIPDWARPYALALLGRAEGLTAPELDPATGLYKPRFTPYGGRLVAGFNPLQEQAMLGLAGMRTSAETGEAAGLARQVGEDVGAKTTYAEYQPQDFYEKPTDTVAAESFGTPQMQQYMSPYMQGVVEQQKRGAVEDYLKQLPGMRSSAARSGALGGSREAIMQSEARKGLAQQLGNIEATGLQSAYQQAASQFGADRAAQMQAALANQQAGLQKAQAGAQFGLAGKQLGEQSRQFGAGLGLQGLAQKLAAAQALGGFGQQGYQQQMGIREAQLGAGAQGQALEQQRLSSLYQQFIEEQQAPYKQLEFMSGILRGVPATAGTTSFYQQPPSSLGMIAGLTGGLGGIFGNLGR